MDERKIQEYFQVVDRYENNLILAFVLASLVFLIALIIILANGLWAPFDGDASVGKRWGIMAILSVCLVYVALGVGKAIRRRRND